MLTDLDERMEYGEDRWVSIGMLSQLTVVVVWTERDNDTIRIISARKANKHERRRFRRAHRAYSTLPSRNAGRTTVPTRSP